MAVVVRGPDGVEREVDVDGVGIRASHARSSGQCAGSVQTLDSLSLTSAAVVVVVAGGAVVVVVAHRAAGLGAVVDVDGRCFPPALVATASSGSTQGPTAVSA